MTLSVKTPLLNLHKSNCVFSFSICSLTVPISLSHHLLQACVRSLGLSLWWFLDGLIYCGDGLGLLSMKTANCFFSKRFNNSFASCHHHPRNPRTLAVMPLHSRYIRTPLTVIFPGQEHRHRASVNPLHFPPPIGIEHTHRYSALRSLNLPTILKINKAIL